jgi:fido (protein-threonine AMPylation protein)
MRPFTEQYSWFLVSEVHPFADGNGRAARIMMNAELIAKGQERIVVPTAYRIDYLGALRALSQGGHTTRLIRMLDYAQRYSHAIDWRELAAARRMLTETRVLAAETVTGCLASTDGVMQNHITFQDIHGRFHAFPLAPDVPGPECQLRPRPSG